jgi:hypothetical protein
MRLVPVARIIIRATGLTLLVLGALFWAGRAAALIPVHMLLGLIFVLTLWTLAVVAARAGAGGFAAFAGLWGIIVIALGMTQQGLLVGSLHWIIRVLHLGVGIAAMGIADTLAKKIEAGSRQAVG